MPLCLAPGAPAFTLAALCSCPFPARAQHSSWVLWCLPIPDLSRCRARAYPVDSPVAGGGRGPVDGSLGSTSSPPPLSQTPEPRCPPLPGALQSCEEFRCGDAFQLSVYETSWGEKKKSHLNYPCRPFLPSGRILPFMWGDSTVPPEECVGEKARDVVRELAHPITGRIATFCVNYMMNVHYLSPLLSGCSA